MKLPDDESRLTQAFAVIYQRSAAEHERAFWQQFIADYLKELEASKNKDKSQSAWAALVRVMISGNEFVYVD